MLFSNKLHERVTVLEHAVAQLQIIAIESAKQQLATKLVVKQKRAYHKRPKKVPYISANPDYYQKPHKCKVCSKKLVGRIGLMSHQRHTGH
jgi:hypothetical protein